MKTPKKYNDMLKNGEITTNVLGEVIFSFNKRAKNYRDQERKYRHENFMKHLRNRYYYDKYDNDIKNREKKEEMYKKKEILLDYLKPSCIHIETKEQTRKNRYYDYEDKYHDIIENKNKYKIVKQGEYVDFDLKAMVNFVDVLETKEIKLYYLFYEVAGFKFHRPIEAEQVEKYNLELKNIDELTTTGKEITELLSLQFCNKVVENIDYLGIKELGE